MPAARALLPSVLIAASVTACSGAGAPPTADTPAPSGQVLADRSPTPASTPGVVMAETVTGGLVNPWAIAFLPDGRALVTERPGRLRLVSTSGQLSAPLAGVPAVAAGGQGGLLDVAVDPEFATTRRVYLSFAEAGSDGAGTAVARGTLGDGGLTDVQVIYRQVPKVSGGNHFGSRLVFGADGLLYVTQGDRFAYRERAQELGAGLGKVVRVHPDGRIPEDNPFVGTAGARPEIWSLGHRNVQAAALDPRTGQLWTVEHGARGGDELNHPERGKNYGWPVITYGVDYSGARIGEGTAKAGLEQPVYYWDPVIAPSGMAFYTADAIPGWRGSVLIGSLSPGALVRLELTNGRVTKEERYLGELGERIRDVAVGPDGLVYLVTDSGNGKVLRVRAAR